MPAVEMVTNMCETLCQKWQIGMEKVIQILKYGILMGQIMEAVNSKEGEGLLFGPAISPWERGEENKKK